MNHISFHVRQACLADAQQLCAILNDIIAIGGTTAWEDLLSEDEFCHHFLNGPHCIACFTAEAVDKKCLGFQSLSIDMKLPEGWADIATFTRRTPRVPGIGTALFSKTATFARSMQIEAINATIRADNYSGIPYYEKMGFKTYNTVNSVPLKDGTLVDRVSKSYLL